MNVCVWGWVCAYTCAHTRFTAQLVVVSSELKKKCLGKVLTKAGKIYVLTNYLVFINSHSQGDTELKSSCPLTTMKYRTQSAEQRVSKTKVILPSSEPDAPVTDVGGLFDR